MERIALEFSAEIEKSRKVVDGIDLMKLDETGKIVEFISIPSCHKNNGVSRVVGIVERTVSLVHLSSFECNDGILKYLFIVLILFSPIILGKREKSV